MFWEFALHNYTPWRKSRERGRGPSHGASAICWGGAFFCVGDCEHTITNLAHRSKFDPHRLIWTALAGSANSPNSGRIWPIRAPNRPSSDELGEFWRVFSVGANYLGQHRPMLARIRPISGDFSRPGSTSTYFGANLAASATNLVPSAGHVPKDDPGMEARIWGVADPEQIGPGLRTASP